MTSKKPWGSGIANTTNTNDNTNVTTTIRNDEQQQQQADESNPTKKIKPNDDTNIQNNNISNTTTTTTTTIDEQDWQSLLEKSNKLNDPDRLRVQQFFTNRLNPTPGVMIYKMKLNEQKMIDPQTQQPCKETLYLELDYDTFGYKN